MTEPTLSVIMPALNERPVIHDAVCSTLCALDDLCVSGEVIVIDDGSTDGTDLVVEDEMEHDPRVRMVRHETPQGVGASFWDGVGHARGEFVCMLPGDNENDPAEIVRYLDLLDHVDIVVPFVFNKESRSWFRNVLSYAYQTIINTTFRVRFNYTNGTVLYRRCILDEITVHSGGFFYQTDLLVRLVKRGYLFAEVPCRLKVREHGQSRAISARSLLRVMCGYLKLMRDIYFGRDHRTAKRHFSESQAALRRAAPGKVTARRAAPHDQYAQTTPLGPR